MPRNPVTASINTSLKVSTKDAVASQMFNTVDGDITGNTKEKVLACPHGIMKNFREESSDSDDESRVSNPPNWESNQARKTLDMQWYFTAGPLRVSGLAGKHHWRRLHASNTTMIPQPKGGLHVIKSNIPHRGDKLLEEDVKNSGVAKPRPERTLPPVTKKRDIPGTPELRKRVLDAAIPPLPKRPKGPSSVITDGSSIFSVTTVARTAVSKANEDSKSTVSGVSQQSKRSALGSKVGGGSQVASTSHTHKSKASVISSKIEEEKKAVQDLSEELKTAADRLRYLEKVLSRRERREP